MGSNSRLFLFASGGEAISCILVLKVFVHGIETAHRQALLARGNESDPFCTVFRKKMDEY